MAIGPYERPGNSAFRIVGKSVHEVVLVREVKYGDSFAQNKASKVLGEGELVNDKRSVWSAGFFGDDGSWELAWVEPEDLFDEARTAFSEIRKRVEPVRDEAE